MRVICLLLMLGSIVLPRSAGSEGQSSPAAIYAIPEEGAWVEYAWKGKAAGKDTREGSLRISSLGGKVVKGKACRWLEFSIKTQGKENENKIRKVLVDSQQFAKKSLAEAILEGHAASPGKKATPMSPGQIAEFFHFGLGDPLPSLKAQDPAEELAIGQGKLMTRRVSALAKKSDRALEYCGWLSSKVPTGWAKMEIWQSLGEAGAPERIFQATIQKQGQGARSELPDAP